MSCDKGENMPEIEPDNIQIALVTGASRGIGKAIAIALARTKRFVYLNYNLHISLLRFFLFHLLICLHLCLMDLNY